MRALRRARVRRAAAAFCWRRIASRRCVGAPRNDRGSFPGQGDAVELEEPVEEDERDEEDVMELACFAGCVSLVACLPGV